MFMFLMTKLTIQSCLKFEYHVRAFYERGYFFDKWKNNFYRKYDILFETRNLVNLNGLLLIFEYKYLIVSLLCWSVFPT
jgi:hypothetical protein